MERDRRNNGGNGVENYQAFESPLPSSSRLFSVSSSPLPISSCSSLSSGGVGVPVGGGATNYIEHSVSRFDTLAGVAIKYGVEVSDIKKMNGLVSDLQMFALKTLYIPLPGRHPPSPILSNGSDAPRPTSSDQTPPRRRHSDLFDSFQSLKLQSPQRNVSSAMHSLQGYYQLNSLDEKTVSEECAMSAYQNGNSHYLEDGSFGKPSPCMNPPLSIHRKCKSVASCFMFENEILADGLSLSESDNWSNNLARWRQKSETNFNSRPPEKLLKNDASNNGFSIVGGKGLALRTKAASRTVPGTNGETIVGNISSSRNLSGVKKSFSTPSLQESENSTSIWPTVNWSLKPDLQALSTAATTRPIFDGLPKPVTSRRNKTAVD